MEKSGGANKKSWNKKLIIGLISAAIIIILTVIVCVLVFNNGNNGDTEEPTASVEAKSVCSAENISKFMSALKTADSAEELNLDELTTLTDEIYAKDGYIEDPNCVYMLLRYEILASSTGNASSLVESYEKIKDPKLADEILYSGDYFDIDTLKAKIEEIVKIEDLYNNTDADIDSIMTDAAKKAEEHFDE